MLLVVGECGRVLAVRASAASPPDAATLRMHDWRVHAPVSSACVVDHRWLVYVAAGVAYSSPLFVEGSTSEPLPGPLGQVRGLSPE